MYHSIIEAGILTENDRVELINGDIIDMSPISSQHATTVKLLNAKFIQLVENKFVVGVQDPISLGENSEPEPDISLLLPPIEKYYDRHPAGSDIVLVVEVSLETHKYDREVKLPMYAEAQILVYMIVDLNKNCIELHTEPNQGNYTKQEIFFPGDTIKLPLIEKPLAVSDIIRV
jgi:Uma2 family endonuclease